MRLAFRPNQALAKWAPFLLAVAFAAVFFWLNSRQYLSFQLQAPDLDRFNQAIWNTLQGRFLYTTITESSILGNHFTPYMALLSPLLLIWGDVRVLFLVQTISIAATGLILYKIVEDKHPKLAIWFLLAFYLNPVLHQVALFELRRVTLAMPFLALMLYGLYKDRRGLMLVGMLLALLCKEDLGLIVAMVGLYLLVFKRDWKWGLPITVFGLAWSLAMLLWVIPSFSVRNYPQIRYFNSWGDSFPDIVLNVLTHPLQVLQVMIDQDSLRAFWRALLPLAIVLPFLAADYLILFVPLLALMLISNVRDMHALQRWYMAPILPILFAAVAVAIGRLPERYARWSVVGLLVATLAGFVLYSRAPLGGRFEPYRYELTERDDLVWEIVEAIPDEATVAAQVAFSTQLAHREHIYVYPWFRIGQENMDYFLMARNYDSYPIPSAELDWEINNLVANPDYVVEREADGIYLIRQGGEQQPSKPMNRFAEEAIKLDRVEVAVADERGFYRTTTEEPVSVSPGQQLRVTLYWEALDAPNAERTVSVRIQDSAGALVAQKDMLPGDGSRPTSWWEPGWRFRDVYYLTVAPEATPGPASLDLVLYDSFTQERIAFEGGEETVRLMEMILAEPAVAEAQ